MSFKHILILLILIFVSTSVDAKNYYRFKDSNGRLVVKDYLPNSALKSGYEVINESGRVVEKVAPIMTREEKLAEELRQEKIAAQQEKERKMRQHDRMLLRQYRTIDDIKRTEKNQTASLNINISILNSHNKNLEKKLSNLQSSAANYERKGTAVPKSILTQIDATKDQIEENTNSIARYKSQVEVISEQFKNDLVRFKELQAMRLVEQYAENQRSLPTTTKVECDSYKSCERSWKLAQIFAHENASNKLEIVTDSLIISSKPKNDEQLGLSITRIPADNDAMQIVLEVQCYNSEAGEKLCNGEKVNLLKSEFVQYISQKNS
ncbi:hypothetical protein GCM10009123_10670 [Kangiella japonica]|uniref:DUF4124 domain-containing protein n=1 Tax=Kangiella japonica TaxID=647384 RepID=A0ABN0SXJ6_9GAMM